MTVFKSYFRIMKYYKWILMLPFIIFVVIALAINSQLKKGGSEFEISKPNVYLVQEDQESMLVDGMLEFLDTKVNFVQLKNVSYQDAMFFREIDYVLIIPEGFASKFLAGEESSLSSTQVPDSQTAYLVSNYVNQYLNDYRMYTNANLGLTEGEIINNVIEDLSIQTPITSLSDQKEVESDAFLTSFFNSETYIIIMVITSGISTVMIVFNKREVKIRNMVSSKSERSKNMQLFFGAVTFSLASWLILTIFVLVLAGDMASGSKLIYYLINSFVFLITIMAMGFLMGTTIHSYNVQSAVMNVTSLGLSFISGAFVPQEFMSGTILNISKFFPVYWNIYVNNTLKDFGGNFIETLAKIGMPLLIQLGFAIGMICIALVISRQKNYKEL